MKNYLFVLLIMFMVLVMTETNSIAKTFNYPNGKQLKLSGFRVGLSHLILNKSNAGISLKNLMDTGRVNHTLTQFGYQVEYNKVTTSGSAISEFLILGSGMDQGIVIPSISWIVGYRFNNGLEFGGGHNMTIIKTNNKYYADKNMDLDNDIQNKIDLVPAFEWMVGYSLKADELVVPIRLSVAQSRAYVKLSLLTGFNF